ncbi:MAG: DNA integrity scanning protein DisA nucleotide-binding domain protein [Humidesulfovibrio sp.]|uniref:DNA integrity scanning protein DisA nucleotide-binding domain protein n=1 Tax=Humidesulfovibrio sp. TaxID=2910988 RepID=UPI0027FEEA96|nr:DNA integrity scanning protein DisA nucleotide-binding domain protein [Humidesulfovibrio sp.]MDQ7836170.1 DNA integrity scanning protein DisA nucleotide-binding domain protein [Humidesulfovibrio sp.]
MSLDRHHMLSLHNVLEGLRLGLCDFSGPSRVALIYAQEPGEPLRVVDPQGLLAGHEPRLQEYYLDSGEWCEGLPDPELVTYFDQAKSKRIGLAGVVSLGGRAPGVAYQMWFTDRHVDLCAPGPIRRWLEHALLQFSHSMCARDIPDTGSIAHMIQEMAPHAVHDFIVDMRARTLGPDTRLRVYNILAAIMQISKTPEEGAWARGHLAFVEPSRLSRLHYLMRFPRAERPRLDNSKHVRKMLQSVERSPRMLVSDGEHIIGIASGELPPSSLCALFNGRHGMLSLDGGLVCSFSDGAFQSTNRKPNLVILEEALLEWPLDADQRDALFSSVSRIVAYAGEQKYGCAIIVDPYTPLLPVSGHSLETPLPLEDADHLALAAALAKVDGALHVSAVRNQLCGFACLMDGPSFPGEDRSRGARYNSALRFTHSHPELLVVVVSSDRPVSVMQKGADISRPPVWPAVPSTLRPAPTLEHWLAEPKA